MEQDDNLNQRQLELERRNQELEDRKRQIERQLQNFDTENYRDQEIDLAEEDDRHSSENGHSNSGQDEEQTQEPDIINQLQSIKKANLERDRSRLEQLKKQFDANKLKISKNEERLHKLNNNIDLAKAAVQMKNELKREIESKGKKLTEQSKKWIGEVSKLNDKCETVRNNVANLQKDLQTAKTQFDGTDRKLTEIKRQKAAYESEEKTVSQKIEKLKTEIQKAKGLIKDKQIEEKQMQQKSQKEKERQALNQKRLQRQKNELIKAYKKLSQYISLLRKTNTHLQTANSLGFDLKEYLQAIDKADMIV